MTDLTYPHKATGSRPKPEKPATKTSPKHPSYQRLHLASLAKKHTETALRVIVELMTGRTETGLILDVENHVRLAAAKELLDRAYGRPAQAVQHETADGAPLFTFLQSLVEKDQEEDGTVLVIDHRDFTATETDGSEKPN